MLPSSYHEILALAVQKFPYGLIYRVARVVHTSTFMVKGLGYGKARSIIFYHSFLLGVCPNVKAVEDQSLAC